jgi:hypothetical protein
MIDEVKIEQNWERFVGLAEQFADSESHNRWDRLVELFNLYSGRLSLMPASSKKSYHSAYVGGFVQHTLNVYDAALALTEVWKAQGAKIDFTLEELTFVALTHDLGKMGDDDHEFYVEQTDTWRKEKLGELYGFNKDLSFMKDHDRTIFILMNKGITVSETEYLAIKLQAGLYDEGNKAYLVTHSEEFRLHSNLPYIIHQADAMSARIESMGDRRLLKKKKK